MESQVVEALQHAAAESSDERQIGQDRLSELKTSPGFYTGLLTIYMNRQAYDVTTRWLAVIQLKNTVDAAWRQPHRFGLSPDERDAVKSGLLAEIARSDPDDMRLQRQLAVVVAKVARQEFPRTWPSLLNDVMDLVQAAGREQSMSRLDTAIEAAYRISKALSSARIGPSRTQFSAWATEVLPTMWSVFGYVVPHSLPIAYTTLKLVGVLLDDGHPHSNRFEGPRNVYTELLPALQQALASVDEYEMDSTEMLQKIALRVAKIYYRLFERKPLAVCNMPAMPETLTFFCDFIVRAPQAAHSSGVGDNPGFWERLAIIAMQIIREASRIKPPKNMGILPLNMRPHDDASRRELQNAYDTVAMVMTPERLDALTKSLLGTFFTLTPDDVELWRTDPADYFFEEQAASCDVSVSLCAKRLFGLLLKQYPEAVTPFARRFVVESLESSDVYRIEAALKALEFGATAFQPDVDLLSLLTQLRENRNAVVRRRVCLLVASWLIVGDGNPALQRAAYDLVVDSLWHPDLVVQLAALQLVRASADDLDFDADMFEATAAEAVFQKIWELLQPRQNITVKTHVLGVLGVLVETMGAYLTQDHINQILNVLPIMWEAETRDGRTHTVQTLVLQTLSLLAGSIADPSTTWPVALPLLDVATDPQQPIFSLLADDALRLWKALIVHAPVSKGPLTSMFSRLVDLLETRTEFLSQLLSLLESYWLLSPAVADEHPLRVAATIGLYLTEFEGRAGESLAEIQMLLFNAEQLAALTSDLSITVSSGLLQALAMWVTPAAEEERSMAATMAAGRAGVAISRIALRAPQLVSQNLNLTQIESMCTKANGISEPRHRKLICLGCTALLQVSPQLFSSMPARYINMWTQTLDEVPASGQCPSPESDPSLSRGPEDDRTAEERRSDSLRMLDPVTMAPLREAISSTASMLRAQGMGHLLDGTTF